MDRSSILVSHRSVPSSARRAVGLFFVAGVLAAGCSGVAGSIAPSTTAPSVPASTAAPRASSSHDAGPSPSAAATPPTTTATAWGRIWDDLPATFAPYPGAMPADGGEGPASAILALPAKSAAVVAWYRTALKTAGYRVTAVDGPLEDGSTVIDAVGADPGCRVQATIVPRGTRSSVTILFAAACPFR